MKVSRQLFTIVCATAVIGIALIVWQARTIRGLRMERAALRQDLMSALGTAFDESRTSAGESNVVTLELIKLRHENRQLQESLVEARASRPRGVKELVRSLLPSGSAPVGPLQFRPEWKGMEPGASNNYVAAIRAVNNATNEYVRFLSLTTAAKASLAVRRTEEARRFAEDAMILNDKYSRGLPEEANGDVVHDANLVLGRIAVEEGRLEDAKRYLLAAGQTRGSPVLGSFGPNMGLAKDLLERGEQATVLEYFELCGKFWARDKLDLWKADVEAGRIPEFRANLNY